MMKSKTDAVRYGNAYGISVPRIQPYESAASWLDRGLLARFPPSSFVAL